MPLDGVNRGPGRASCLPASRGENKTRLKYGARVRCAVVGLLTRIIVGQRAGAEAMPHVMGGDSGVC